MTDWRPRWYYIMKNKTSDKMYIGQTVMTEMNLYCGSGRYWIAHCAKHVGHHRDNVEVIFQQWFDSETEAKKWLNSLPFQYWKSNKYANQAIETTKDSPLCGLPLETRQRNGRLNSIKLKGRPKSAKHAANISKGKKGIPQTPEHIAALSAVRKGRKLSPEHIKARSFGIKASRLNKLIDSIWKETTCNMT